MTRPPSSMPCAPVCPFFDHRVQACPPVVPDATSVPADVSTDAGAPLADATVAGEHVELAFATCAVSSDDTDFAGCRRAVSLVTANPTLPPATATTTADSTTVYRRGRQARL